MMSKYDDAADVSQLPVIIKRKTPSNIQSKALAPVYHKKLTNAKVYYPYKDEQICDIATVSRVPANSSRPSQISQKKHNYQIDFPIYDAKYEELVDDELETTKKREYKTVPSRDARNLVVAKRSNSLEKRKPSESAIAAISDQKRRTKSEILNFNPAKPSRQARKSPNDDWLIDSAFEQIVKAGKAVGKVGKVAVREGFHAAKTGIRAIGELGGEFEKTPIAQNLRRNADVEYVHMRSAGRRARDSIAGAGNVTIKKTITPGALVAQKGVVAKTAMSDGSIATNPQGITARYERWMDGRTEVYFYYKGRRMTHQQVGRILTPKQISRLKQEAKNGITRKTHAGVV